LRRNTPALWNLAWSKHQFWDGRAPSLEVQARAPIEAPDEMGGDWPTISGRLEADPEMSAVPPPSGDARGVAGNDYAGHGRVPWSPPTRFDAWIVGDCRALDPGELRGSAVYRQGRVRALP
jgi:cytochrome c peroxidase